MSVKLGEKEGVFVGTCHDVVNLHVLVNVCVLYVHLCVCVCVCVCRCYVMNNFNALFSFSAAFQSSQVYRLKHMMKVRWTVCVFSVIFVFLLVEWEENCATHLLVP